MYNRARRNSKPQSETHNCISRSINSHKLITGTSIKTPRPVLTRSLPAAFLLNALPAEIKPSHHCHVTTSQADLTPAATILTIINRHTQVAIQPTLPCPDHARRRARARTRMCLSLRSESCQTSSFVLFIAIFIRKGDFVAVIVLELLLPCTNLRSVRLGSGHWGTRFRVWG